MKYLITVMLLAFCINTNAQSFKDILNRKKNEIVKKAQNKIENKIDNKIDNTIDKGLDGIDGAVSGKKSKKNRKSENAENNNEAEASASESAETPTYNESANISSNEMIITTNIKCAKGKELMEELIRDKRNVMSVSIDSGSGKVYVSIDNNDNELKETILKLIYENGFSANGKQPKTKINVCK